MRCRNCNTVMMETDTVCMSCHATVESATAGPPELTGDKPNGLAVASLHGGALGGLAYAGLATSQLGAFRAGRGGGVWSTCKKILGVLLIAGGGLFMIVAFFQYNSTRELAQRIPTAATTTELRTRAYVEKAPSWVSYTFDESKPIEEVVTRRRKGHGGDVKARCMLVRVDNRWLLATVAEGFEGNELVGQLLPIDAPISQPLIERLRQEESDPKTILPYEFFAVEGCPSDQHFRFTAAAWTGAIGLIGFLFGLYLLFGALAANTHSANTRATLKNSAQDSVVATDAQVADAPPSGE